MYAVVIADEVRELLAMNTAFVLDGHQYPANWLTHASVAARQLRHIFPVEASPRPVTRYGLITRNPPEWDAAAQRVRLTYALQPADMAQARRQESARLDRFVATRLAASDQIVLNAHDTGQSVPAQWTAYRALVTAERQRLAQAIAAASDEAALVAALLSPDWPPAPPSFR